MSSRRKPGAHRGVRVALRVLAGVAAGVCGLAFAVLSWLVLSSLFGPPSRDPHGYAIIFGTILAIPAGVLTTALAPFAFSPDRRAIVSRISTIAFLIITAALLLIWFTA
ncbi:hypothetical protein [Aeromicrobium piscarium]|uniref:Major facilitator superfamily (MFS) profile domain-containing protein n=1 Tax=Aeromicrobium piscarium TaxID=2590901 RepID=A0A554RHY7_9ACTN|nr:hypothetical protein [Aeromicrobium piscarium]TSD53788.1 hypothetical protein FNM00_17900 [Aeromicrobium piscarium]